MGPKDHTNTKISRSSSKAQYKGHTRNHGLQDPYFLYTIYRMLYTIYYMTICCIGALVESRSYDAVFWGAVSDSEASWLDPGLQSTTQNQAALHAALT